MCTVTSGDPPIKISWFKDGHPLLSSSEKSSSRAKQSNSVLSNHYYRSSMFKSPGNQNHQHYYDYLNQIQIVSINDFMSSLIINNISRHHQGTYVCMASSPIATTNISAYLTVKASPMWLLKPVDRVAIAGESLTLDCQTSGQPQPVIRWKFLKNEVEFRVFFSWEKLLNSIRFQTAISKRSGSNFEQPTNPCPREWFSLSKSFRIETKRFLYL